MPIASPVSRLKINGVIVPETGAGSVVLTRTLLHNFDGPDEIEFTEFEALDASYKLYSKVELEIAFDTDEDETIGEPDYVTRFSGVILDSPQSFGQYGPQVDYRATGLKWVAGEIRVTHPQSGKTEIVFNLPPNDQEYEEDLSALELGEILRRVLTYDTHATDLWYAGVTTYTADPPFIDPDKPELGRAYNSALNAGAMLKQETLADLDGIDIVPFEAVRFSGNKLWQQIENVLQDFAPSRACEITGEGLIRFHDTREPAWTTLTLGSDPIALPSLTRDGSRCYGAVQIVGDDEVEGETFTTAGGSLQADWTAADQAAWKWEDHAVKTDSVSSGTIISIGPTTVTIRPTSGALSWVANRWSNDRAFIELSLPIGPNNPSKIVEMRRVVSNTACPVNGTSVIFLDYPLAYTGYTEFKLTGQSTNPRRFVWRKYKFTDPDKAARVVDRFPYEVFWEMRTGGQWIQTPVGKNYRQQGSTGDPLQSDLFFDLFTDSDGVRKVLSNEPTVKAWTTQANLDLGGANVTAPTDILVFVPISLGILTTRYPAVGFTGLGATEHGMKRTLIVPMTDWRYRGERARMTDFAESIHDTVKDPVVSGTLRYVGLWRPGVEESNNAIKLQSDFATTPWEGEKLSIRAVEIVWPLKGATNHETMLRVSNQRRAWTGDRQFTPASFIAGGPLEGASELDARFTL